MKKCWLQNKTVLITGGASGIGAGIARLLITKYACKVIAVIIDDTGLEQTVRELGENSGNFTCLYYDVSIEPVYLKGDFTVGKDMSLSKRTGLPEVSSSLYREGYPFFKGELMLEGNIDYSGEGGVMLGIKGRFMTAEVEANSKRVLIVLNSRKDIADMLHKGNNVVKIVLRSSLRNLFGPHHYIIPEPMGVSPGNFAFRGEWKDDKNPENYTDEYHSVPFGADKLMLIFRKGK